MSEDSSNNNNYGWGSDGYNVVNSGNNRSGNHYCRREGSSGKSGFHYSNSDKSYYYDNPNGSKYYDDGKGNTKYTSPSGKSYRKSNAK
ncbi:hypothetical protein BXZ70DRAFT_923826 [Cristinia sonorae]|uniref:Uncharacterized protein n=1 Tax=Cristinia sonorae TaxID=1940300 RepID=A0A8K0UTG7_9AGAR|nr:hypothetical protein BXZ70DRAFT_923826 [Cristinia sonorae]